MLRALIPPVLAIFGLAHPLSAATFASAEATARTGRADEALNQLQALTSANPRDAAAYNLICRIQGTLQRYDEAIPACEKAFSLSPSNSNYSLYLARAYGAKAQHSGAFKGMSLVGKIRGAFERAVSLDGSNIEALSDLGEFYVSAPGIVGGGTDKAQPLVARLAVISPARSHRLAGMIAAKNNDFSTAESEFKKEVEVAHTAEAYYDLANYYRNRKQFDQAAASATTAIQMNKRHDGDSIDAAILLVSINRNLPVAQQAFRDYLASPNKSEGTPAFQVNTMLGDMLAKQGDQSAAALQYKAALSLAHDYPPARKASSK